MLHVSGNKPDSCNLKPETHGSVANLQFLVHFRNIIFIYPY
jgi:hypothetical protein